MLMRARAFCAFSTLLALAIAADASAQPITLKFSHFLGPASFFQVDVVEPWAKELEAKTNGKVKVEIFDGATPVGKIGEQASNAKAGVVDIALGLRGAEGERFPGSSIIELPFLVPNAAVGSRALWMLYKDGGLAGEYRDYKVLALFVHNPGLIHTTNKRVIAPSDLRGLRLRAPNKTVAAALDHLGAVPMVLQVSEVMPAVQEGRVEGIVTNWGNPLRGFNDYMRFHADTQFYTSAFFVLMNRESYERLPADSREALDSISGEAWVAKFGPYWDKWDKPVRDGAHSPGHEIITPDAATMAQWKTELQPVTERYLARLGAQLANAQASYDKLVAFMNGGN
jgi:TRAP-type C4-dicarboxylate transport system substrate-binding protein